MEPWKLSTKQQTILKNLFPVNISWPIAFQFINNGFCSYHDIDNARNICNDERVEVLKKAKTLYETDSNFTPNPDLMFKVTKDTLTNLFQDNVPVLELSTNAENIWDKVVKSSGSGAPYFCKKAELKDVSDSVVSD